MRNKANQHGELLLNLHIDLCEYFKDKIRRSQGVVRGGGAELRDAG